MSRTPIQTDRAPQAIGTYSQAIVHGGVLYLSGQIPLDPVTGAMVTGDFEAEARRVFENLTAVCEEAGTSLDQAVKLNVYLIDLGNFADLNRIMGEYVREPFPARAAVQVAALPKGAQIEIDGVIALPE